MWKLKIVPLSFYVLPQIEEKGKIPVRYDLDPY